MTAASALGHGVIAGGLAGTVLLLALATRRRRLARLAGAALLAVVVAGVAANLVKLAVDSPRPHVGGGSPGFPSGHTAVAFAAAVVLARAIPAAAALFSLVALLTGVARLYLEAHFVVDVVGGAVIGGLLGWGVATRLVPAPARPPVRAARWLWALPLTCAVLAATFFLAYEHAVAAQRAGEDRPAGAGRPDLGIAFGQVEARPFLRSGWSVDERWGGRVPFVWAVGDEAALHLPSLPAANHDVRLRLAPFVRRAGLSCQQAEVSVNGWKAARLVLARGWRDYALAIPGQALRPGDTEVRFRFAYTARPGEGDERPLSVAFAVLEARRRP